MPEFELLFPTLLAKSAEVHALLRPVAYALFIVGTILLVRERFTARTLILHLVRLLVLTALLVQLPPWTNSLQTLLQESLLSSLGVDPQHVHEQYQALVIAKRELGSGTSWWDLLGQLSGFSVEAFITGALWLLGHLAGLLLFWAYLFQKIILLAAYALSPLLIGFLGIRALAPTGQRFLLNLSGVLLWPLGWAVAALITQGILDFMTDPSVRFLDPTASGYRLQTTFGLAVLAFWIAFSTVAAPLLIQRALSLGTLMGAELLSHASTSFLQTAATTAGAAAVASHVGVPLVTATAAGLAAGLSTLSTAAGLGSAGAIIIAGSGLPPRSARGRPGDDLTGDYAVRELLARHRSPSS